MIYHKFNYILETIKIKILFILFLNTQTNNNNNVKSIKKTHWPH
jgi:hypothetical protein